MPGSASAAVIRVRLDFSAAESSCEEASRKIERDPLVAATTASADAVAAGGAFLARVDVLRRPLLQNVGVELHLAFRKIAFFPRLRRIERRASIERDERGDGDRPLDDRRAHHRGDNNAWIFCSKSAPLASLNPC